MIFAAATASTPAPATSPAPAAPTLQQRFDQAMELLRKDECIKAVAQFEELKKERAFRPEGVPGSMLLVQQGRCLVKIGLEDIGERYIDQGLPVLKKAGNQFDVDVASALTAMGDAAYNRWEYALAKTRYLEALAMGSAADAMALNVKLAKATAFDGGPEPLAYAVEAIRLAAADPATAKQTLPPLRTIYGRILLNQGNFKQGYAELKQALSLSGGLDLRVNLADISLRSDVAVAAQLAGDQAGAREYLAYTGAGRLRGKNLTSGISMEPPVCGAETGLRPEDFAIVEVAIGDRGTVLRSQTIYTPGSAQVAAQFARAAQNWVWDPDTIKATPPVFRLATHIEVRCTTLGQQVPSTLSPMDQRFSAWAAKTLDLSAELAGTVPAGENRRFIDQLKVLAQREDVSKDGLKTAAIAGLLVIFQPISVAEMEKRFDAGLAAAQGAHAPQEVINWLTVRKGIARLFTDEGKPSDLLPLLQKPELAADPLATNTVRLLAVTDRYTRKPTEQGSSLLQSVAQDDRLPQHHPLRQLANLTLANAAAKQEKFADAERFFQATGLTEEQCALIGPKPAMSRVGISGNDYPSGAFANGFEGWLRVEFDILADGRTTDVRPLIAYPPFIFNEASVTGLKRSRFDPSYRPAGGNACNANRQGFRFALPG